jgi:hypothetical protein
MVSCSLVGAEVGLPYLAGLLPEKFISKKFFTGRNFQECIVNMIYFKNVFFADRDNFFVH